jgi:AsmA protein
MQSELEVSFFPTLGLKTGRIVMLDPDIFGGEPFVSVDSASLQVSLRSLLERTVEVEEVALHGVRLNLITNAVGQHNWEYRVIRDAGRVDGTGVTPLPDPDDGQGGKPGAFALKIQELRLADTRVTYRDMQTGTAYSGRLDSFMRPARPPTTTAGKKFASACGGICAYLPRLACSPPR